MPRCAPCWKRITEIPPPVFYAIGNAHLDLVWLWPLAETIRKTARTFAAQLRMLDAYPEYRFLQSQPALYELCREQYPALYADILKAAKDGRWIPEGAMWVEPDTNIDLRRIADTPDPCTASAISRMFSTSKACCSGCRIRLATLPRCRRFCRDAA